MSTKKRRSPEGKVKLYHGPWVKKSTARWLDRRDEGCGGIALGFFIFMLIIAIISLINP